MDTLAIASRGLSANLAALQVIGHNISNANTDGYSRQRVELQSAGGQYTGEGFFGTGVQVTDVTRAYDAYLTRDALQTQALSSSDAIHYQKLQQLENLFPLGETGLGATMNTALNAWVDVSASPTDLTARTVAISTAQDFTARLRDTAATLDELRLTSKIQTDSVVGAINTLAGQIADLNQRIMAAQGASAAPNDLLDQRDQLIRKLNQHVQTTTVPASDGSLTVFVGGSQALVVGSSAGTMAAVADPIDASKLSIVVKQSSGTFPINEDFLGGGELQGLLTFINKDVPDAFNSLGRMALSLATQFNDQHRLGLDLNGKPGGDFYSVPALPDGYPAASNTGNAVASITVADPKAFEASDYQIQFTGAGAGNVIRLSDGQATAFTSSPITVDGLQFTLTGAAAAGDQITLRPFAAVARDLDVAIASPQELAAASPLKVTPNLLPGSGIGIESVYLSSGSLPAAPGTVPTLTASYDGAGNFNFTASSGAIVGSGTLAYSPGKPLEVQVNDGGNLLTYRITLRGSPAYSSTASTGDVLTIAQGTGAEMKQNSGNGKALLDLRDSASFNGVSLADGYTSVFSKVAVQVQNAKSAATFSNAAATTAETARSNVSGVNLDEEAARLLQYQQSYQAAAKFMQVARSTFDTLIQTIF